MVKLNQFAYVPLSLASMAICFCVITTASAQASGGVKSNALPIKQLKLERMTKKQLMNEVKKSREQRQRGQAKEKECKRKKEGFLSCWYHQRFQLIYSHHTEFAPIPQNDIYLEYEFSGTKGPFNLYGYVDFHNIFNVGSQKGLWDGGSPLFTELEPKLSLDKVFNVHPLQSVISHYYLATDYILDVGNGRDSRSNVLYFGPGVSINTHSNLYLQPSIFVRRNFAHYGQRNAFRWDGYRLQVNYGWPIASWSNGASLNFFGFINWDFGSHLARHTAGHTRTNQAVVDTNVLILDKGHFHAFFAARYFHNGGQWNDGATANFGNGPFILHENGWGEYIALGYNF